MHGGHPLFSHKHTLTEPYTAFCVFTQCTRKRRKHKVLYIDLILLALVSLSLFFCECTLWWYPISFRMCAHIWTLLMCLHCSKVFVVVVFGGFTGSLKANSFQQWISLSIPHPENVYLCVVYVCVYTKYVYKYKYSPAKQSKAKPSHALWLYCLFCWGGKWWCYHSDSF